MTYNLKGYPPVSGKSIDVIDDRYAEWDDIETITAIGDALSTKHQVVFFPADKNIYQKLLSQTPDIVFNVAEGADHSSREAQIPALLEYLGIPYTGSNPFTLSACLDKSRAKEILSYYGVPTPRFRVVHHRQYTNWKWEGRFPVIIKPLWEGSSKGVFNDSVVEEQALLRPAVEKVIEKYNQPAIIEEFIQGREFTVALLGNDEDLRVLPLVEINFEQLPSGARPIYSYEAKWVWDVPEKPLDIFQCPANLDPYLEDNIIHLVKKAYRVLGCRDWCRIDVRLDEKGEPHILELNPLPGILPDPKANSCFPKAARAAGMDYSHLLLSVLDIAIKRTGLLEKEDCAQTRKAG
ncbi:MAG: ATP-grasp domain-containing protein [Chlamydiota bacterium]|nr:ATP-grasp domain-containing protein [Chlamydiota bacterium]